MNEQQIWQKRFDTWANKRIHHVWGDKIEPLVVTSLLRPIFGDIMVSAAVYTNEYGPDKGYRENPRIIPSLEELVVDGYPLYVEFANRHIVKYESSEWGHVALVTDTKEE